MGIAIRQWMIALENYPGWKKWRKQRFAHTLYFGDPLPLNLEIPEEFKFSPEIEKQHAVVIQYLGLQQTIEALKECEYYFRRYPFHGLAVTRASHLTNVCEMYFGRFYELKERLKKYFAAVKAQSPEHRLEIGKFIRTFEKEFDQELRARHGVHHHSRFQDIALDRIFLTDTVLHGRGLGGRRADHGAYREVVKEWVQRVRRRGERADAYAGP
jgi:hypothetical protein